MSATNVLTPKNPKDFPLVDFARRKQSSTAFSILDFFTSRWYFFFKCTGHKRLWFQRWASCRTPPWTCRRNRV